MAEDGAIAIIARSTIDDDGLRPVAFDPRIQM